jgi:serine/threonine protein kinase
VNGRFVKIADFGLSTFHERSDQTHTKELGTENYIAPELFEKYSKYDTKADLYSLGMILMNIFHSTSDRTRLT